MQISNKDQAITPVSSVLNEDTRLTSPGGLSTLARNAPRKAQGDSDVPGFRNRTALTQRYARLLANDEAHQWLTAAYQLRKDYLHSLADPHGRLTWADLAQARWTVAMGVSKYLDFAIQRPELNRSQLLKKLKS